jgi:hypothetical protein
MATVSPARTSVQFSVIAGQNQVVRLSPQGAKVGFQAVGGTPSVQVTMSAEADMGSANWVTLTLTNGQIVVDNVYTAVKFAATAATAKCSIVYSG